jgi:hypothetical protein
MIGGARTPARRLPRDAHDRDRAEAADLLDAVDAPVTDPTPRHPPTRAATSAGTVRETAFRGLLADDLRNLLLDWPRWFGRRLSGWL